MSANYIKLATPSSRHQMMRIEHYLQEGAYCAEQLADLLNITRRRVNEYLRRLHEEGKAHVHKYESVFAGRRDYPVAFYIYGAGADAIHTPKTKVASVRDYRERIKDDAVKQAKIRKQKRIYSKKKRAEAKKIKASAEFRTVYENKDWKNRKGTVRCDFAASWIK